MMGPWGYGNYGNMMGWNNGWGLVGSLPWIVVLIDLVLLGIWLWKKIQEK